MLNMNYIKHYPDFFTDLQCDHAIKLIEERAQPSTVTSPGNAPPGTNTDFRRSDTAYLRDNQWISVQKTKISKVVGLRDAQGEPIQGFRYHEGGYFKPHTDWFDSEKIKRYGMISGNRNKTFLIYLNDDYEGGETNFPNLDFTIKPKKGDAWLWENIAHGRCLEETRHEGTDVLSGTKYILTSFWREFDFDGAGDTEYFNNNYR